MIFTADIGNSNISVGIYSETGDLALSFTVACDLSKSADEYAVIFKNLFDLNGFSLSGISGAMIGSVVPSLTDTVCDAVYLLIKVKAMTVGPGIKTSLDIKTDRPGEVGADIVANSVAALQKFTAPMVLIDFETATTILGINGNRQLTDVFILPGVRSSFEALIRDAAEIPCVPLFPPKAPTGKNTTASVNTGIVYSNAFTVDGFVDLIRKNYKVSDLTVVATGGMAELILPFCKSKSVFCPNLTTEGLYHIYLKNRTN